MIVIAFHQDRVWVKVETYPIMWLGVGRVIRQVDGIIIINQRLDPITAIQGRNRTNAQIATICYSG